MPKLTGACLCGNVSYEADGDIQMMGNCHCTDCRQITGAVYATMAFFKDTDVNVSGEVKSFEHEIDNGNVLRKDFCPNCGSQMFGGNSARPGLMLIRAGTVKEQEQIKPQFDVYTSSKMDCVTLDESIMAFEKMPG